MDLAYLQLRIQRDGIYRLFVKFVKFCFRIFIYKCKKLLKNCFVFLFPHQAQKKKEVIKQKFIDIFKISNSILRGLDVKYWVDGGVCLGIIRENDFLRHDPDIDFGVWDVLNHQRVRDTFFNQGFSSIKTFGTLERGFGETFEKEGVHVDIFYFYESGDFWWNGAGTGETSMRILPKYLFQNLREIEFHGVTFVPEPVEDFLTIRYGEWKIPVKKWHWEMDPYCVRPKTLLTPLVKTSDLKKLKKMCERLVVVTDRPIFAKCIKFVDEVCEPTPDLLERLNPDIYNGEESETTKRLGIKIVKL
jgi:hypothetical protein